MSQYVDGFVIPVPKANIEDYRKLAELARQVWLDHGALDYRECVGDDLDQDKTATFTAAAGAQPDETVVFAWIVYESRERRDAINAAVMEDPRMKPMMDSPSMPFDCNRMVFGGFTTLVS
ncbi:DUF1428 domain-containing protein [Luteolibacter ambystomatis]|uniref:DUF1428 domain-containing protein n=1 Tax=Luteolibacter ambystomatis TaxID=2824561 RepID=A0A975J0Z9_9BACT|nr:DUF1428 domain-containing protein [Luteolibacter ambystomatis]QUE52036.1 DUF1428 domain-containing protein [Luteolibacter ambystomatis]